MASENENEKRDTVADILAEMFKFSDKRIEEGRDHAMTSESVGLVVHQLAKRFEAAWTREREELDKRISDLEAYAKLWTGRADELRLKCDELYAKAKPAGNAAAMRDALVALRDAARNFYHQILNSKYSDIMDEYKCRERGLPALLDLRYTIQKANFAISAPPRQCDVGTAEEQSERFMDFCRPGNRPPNCEKCKVYPKRMNKFWCQLEWAQMPYKAEEGGAK